jgi:hypothetical protein
VYRLAYSSGILAFKMGRRQGARRAPISFPATITVRQLPNRRSPDASSWTPVPTFESLMRLGGRTVGEPISSRIFIGRGKNTDPVEETWKCEMPGEESAANHLANWVRNSNPSRGQISMPMPVARTRKLRELDFQIDRTYLPRRPFRRSFVR